MQIRMLIWTTINFGLRNHFESLWYHFYIINCCNFVTISHIYICPLLQLILMNVMGPKDRPKMIWISSNICSRHGGQSLHLTILRKKASRRHKCLLFKFQIISTFRITVVFLIRLLQALTTLSQAFSDTRAHLFFEFILYYYYIK